MPFSAPTISTYLNHPLHPPTTHPKHLHHLTGHTDKRLVSCVRSHRPQQLLCVDESGMSLWDKLGTHRRYHAPRGTSAFIKVTPIVHHPIAKITHTFPPVLATHQAVCYVDHLGVYVASAMDMSVRVFDKQLREVATNQFVLHDKRATSTPPS